jgi:N-acetylneuraminate synthase
MASFDDVAQAVTVARLSGATDIALLHCVSAYPVPRGSENLQAIDTLHRSFHLPAGLSDHGDDAFAVPIAIAYGACIYERHFVLDGDTDAIDAPVSSTASQFAAIVRDAERARKSLGDGLKCCLPAEAVNVVPSRRSLYTRVALTAGTIIEPCHLAALRPGNGIDANELPHLVGCRLDCDLPAGTAIRLAHLAPLAEQRSA